MICTVYRVTLSHLNTLVYPVGEVAGAVWGARAGRGIPCTEAGDVAGGVYPHPASPASIRRRNCTGLLAPAGASNSYQVGTRSRIHSMGPPYSKPYTPHDIKVNFRFRNLTIVVNTMS